MQMSDAIRGTLFMPMTWRDRVGAGLRWPAVLAAGLMLALVLATIGAGIVVSRAQTTRQILAGLHARAISSAGFVSTFVSQQAEREIQTSRHLLAGRSASGSVFDIVVSSFGSQAAVLLDGRGRLLQVAPADHAILGTEIATRYAHLTEAERGRISVSGVVPSAVGRRSVVAIAVPYQSVAGRRVLSLAYPVSHSTLSALVAHATALKPREVLLVDGHDRVIAGNTEGSAKAPSQTDPGLAAAVERHSEEDARLDHAPARFVAVPVAGTDWHLIIVVGDAGLFAAIKGSAQWLPWVVFAVLAALALLTLGLFVRSQRATRRLAALSAELADAARTDAVTGLLNRRGLEERLTQLGAFGTRHETPLSALVIDVDDFKQFNDTYGHQTGDLVLALLAAQMRTVFRLSDIYGRWGGDEFLALLPGTEADGARAVAGRLYDSVAAAAALPGVERRVTLTIGVATVTGGHPEDLIRQADAALYLAKRAGRRQVRHMDDLEPSEGVASDVEDVVLDRQGAAR
jgi:diguanylate cyclase (GGDEF)-like protein